MSPGPPAADVTVEASPADRDDGAWDAPLRPAAVGGPPVLAVEGFEGPLDWLVELARARRIDLTRLSIVELIDAFAGALETALAHAVPGDLARWADWLVLAATLIGLRSRLLLPPSDPAARAAAQEAEVLRCQLVGRQFVHDAAAWLGRQPQLGHDVFGRGAIVSAPAARETDTTALLRACLLLLRVPEDEGAVAPPRPVFWTVANAIMQIRTQLAGHPDGLSFVACLPLLPPAPGDLALRCRAAVASTFVASLELARVGALHADQTEGVLRFWPVPLAGLT